MGIRVFTGPTGSGKTTSIIKYLFAEKQKGRPVFLFLSADSKLITSRPHVKPGGKMGCRTPGLGFPIDFVETTPSTVDILSKLPTCAVAAFDEAQYFDDYIVDHWAIASDRGIDVVVGMPSFNQFEKLRILGADICLKTRDDLIKEIIEEIYVNEPFPGEKKGYQPIYGIDLEGWYFVRQDSMERLKNILNCAKAYFGAKYGSTQGESRKFLDFGCCSGYFCEGMAQQGFQSTGIDVQKVVIKWGKMISGLNGSNISYVCEDGLKFARELRKKFDIVSTLATVQWIMVQKSYEAGVECLQRLFDATEHVFVLEMGYTDEDVYKGKIDVEIDKNWVENLMRKRGGFEKIVVAPGGTGGRWRDMFFGFRGHVSEFDFDAAVELAYQTPGTGQLPAQSLESHSFSSTQPLFELSDCRNSAPQSRISQKVQLKAELMASNTFVPPGHFYSPIPSLEEIRKNEEKIFGDIPRSIPGIDLNEEEQMRLFEEFKEYYKELPFTTNKTDNLRYFFENPNYSYSDAIFLYCMIRHAKPKRIIEIGSGYSSCVMLDTNEIFFSNSIHCVFIEPFPQLLLSSISESDKERIEIIPENLQEVRVDKFSSLCEGDILFIDSTHVAKVNSDVNYIFFEILPHVAKGVYIHFHDIFYPFEYPKEWIYEGRAWNEAYILRTFLEYNQTFNIVFFNTFLEHFHESRFLNEMPLCMKNKGGSIWIQKR